MIQAVLFDLDRTLLQHHAADEAETFIEGARRCYAYLSAHELPMPAFEQFCRRQRWIHRRMQWMQWLTGGEPDGRRMPRRLCRDYGLQRDESSLAKLGWLWYEPIADRADVSADVVPTLQHLQDHGVSLGLVANTCHQGAVHDMHLEHLGLLEFFPVRAYSTEVGARMPQPQLFEAAIDQLGIAVTQILFVSADLCDILAAHRMGMHTAWLKSDSQHSDGEADHEIRSIAELMDVLELPAIASTRSSPIPPLHFDRVPA